MNEYDRGNLNFLLQADPELLKHWYETTTTDDHEYADELFKQYAEEMRIAKILFKDPVIKNVKKSTMYLQKFSIGNKQ